MVDASAAFIVRELRDEETSKASTVNLRSIDQNSNTPRLASMSIHSSECEVLRIRTLVLCDVRVWSVSGVRIDEDLGG